MLQKPTGSPSPSRALENEMSAPPRIMLLAQGAPGGIGRYELMLWRGLAALAQGRTLTFRTLTKKDWPIHLVEDVRPTYRSAEARKLVLAARLLLEIKRWRPHLVICSHVNLLPLVMLGRLVCPGLRIAVVVHGIEVWARLSLIRRTALGNVGRVWSVSRYTLGKAVTVNDVASDRIELIGSALEDKWMQNEAAVRDSAHDCSVRSAVDSVILTVCRLDTSERYKGVDTVIASLPRLVPTIPNLQYWIAGDGNDVPRLRALAQKAGVAERVIFFGSVSDAELVELYRRCNVFAMPSAKEGFGLVYLEAMAFKKPVVAAHAGGVPEVVEHGRTGLLVEFGDDAGLAEVLLTLLGSPELSRAYGEAGYDRMRTYFSFDQFVDRLDQAIRHAIGDK
jgi:phosphatidyl-myo-inositol dimannoside synthase